MLNRFTQDDHNKIIKIQAHIRGKLVRMNAGNQNMFGARKVQNEQLLFQDNLVNPNGTIYKGQVLPDGCTKHGFGVQTWQDGAKYEGFWENDKAKGRGRFNHVEGDVYDGEWDNDKAHGFGIYQHFNGSVYMGNWQEDKQHGYGEERWQDESEYQG